MKQHPLREFWKTSGWNEGNKNPEDCFAEGKLAIDVWNEAMRIAKIEIRNSESSSDAEDNVDFMRYDVKS